MSDLIRFLLCQVDDWNDRARYKKQRGLMLSRTRVLANTVWRMLSTFYIGRGFGRRSFGCRLWRQKYCVPQIFCARSTNGLRRIGQQIFGSGHDHRHRDFRVRMEAADAPEPTPTVQLVAADEILLFARDQGDMTPIAATTRQESIDHAGRSVNFAAEFVAQPFAAIGCNLL